MIFSDSLRFICCTSFSSFMEKVRYKGIEYKADDRVSIYTGNHDGSIPGVDDYKGTIAEIISKTLASVHTDDGETLTVHLDRLRHEDKA
jgi:hypothetical protein